MRRVRGREPVAEPKEPAARDDASPRDPDAPRTPAGDAERVSTAASGRAPGEKPDAVLAMTVDQVVLDPRNQTPIVILVSEDESMALPIWVGPYEATAILMAIESVELPRPMPHDLMASLVRGSGAAISYIVIHEIRDGMFFAEIVLDHDGKTSSVDARPSDAIALALRADVPILAERAVCDSAEAVASFLEEAQAERYRAFLDAWNPQDVTKYRF